ncbi:response regulator [Halostagnicola kamekurae]|uniref:Response regulator receiver domain-containing protein n=1 Tax=Halostagnicola kamekurae TaxID=619731 RepID=A0A1I6Q3T4_9EURY|nr:response regulator [Halostagnicola kamekurae]SFS46995.1 Response regulator receiver domain-containing protein [Halostagnicola kamekurae]
MKDSYPPQPPTILLVEDNPGDVRLTREAFERSTFDATIECVKNGDETLSYLDGCGDSRPYPQLLLLDLNLPKTDGFAVLEELRRNDERPRIPVLVLTSSNADEDVLRSYELSANAYLTKPDCPEEFIEMVETIESFWFEEVHLPPPPP